MVSLFKLLECESASDVNIDYLPKPMLVMSSDARMRGAGSEIRPGISSSSCRSRRLFHLAVEKDIPFWRLTCGALLDIR